MALRAGYQGFKKLLPGLKLFRPGCLGIDNAELSKIFFPRSEQAVLGTKNLLNPSITTQTKDGLTFTVNADNSVTVNGTATASGGMAVLSTRALSFDRCILNGNYSTDNSKIKLIYYDETSGRQFDVPANNGEVTISGTNGHNCRVAIIYYNGAVVSNLTFKPMIRLASDPDDTYTPYAMTNKELTDSAAELTASASDQKTAINAIITAATEAADFAAFKTAMGAITPVTRSAAPEATREAVPEEVTPEEEPVKKTTRKKSTAKADTEKEGE